jgi:hypothetical protein
MTDGEIHQYERRMQLATMIGTMRGYIKAAIASVQRDGNVDEAMHYLQRALTESAE